MKKKVISSEFKHSKNSSRRKDHWLPQGFLRGFISPSRLAKNRPLWHYSILTKQWTEKSPKKIGYDYGFYDYALGTDAATAANPDMVFARLEREYSLIRAELIKCHFAKWGKHKEFFLEYIQMISVRSPLALVQHETQSRQFRGTTITKVHPDGKTLTVNSLKLKPLSENAIRNVTLTKVLSEAQQIPPWMKQLDWCLRYTDNENNPFCVNDQALYLIGTEKQSQVSTDLINHPDSILVFPLCWQACLFGSSLKFDNPYDQAHPTQLISLRNDLKLNATKFIIAPNKY